jgi:hypothetical protein
MSDDSDWEESDCSTTDSSMPELYDVGDSSSTTEDTSESSEKSDAEAGSKRKNPRRWPTRKKKQKVVTFDLDSDSEPSELIVIGNGLKTPSALKQLSLIEQKRVAEQERLVEDYLQGKIPPKYHILLSSLPISAKAAAVAKLKTLEWISKSSSEYQKMNSWCVQPAACSNYRRKQQD